MHMLKMTSERNSSLGVSSCGLKWENKTYKLKRSIVHIVVPWAFIRVPVPALGPLSSKVCPEVRLLFFLYIYIFTVLLKRKIYDTHSINSTYILQVKFDFSKTF